MFQRVIVVMQNEMDARDALLLGAQVAVPNGIVVAANVLASAPAPLAGGPAGAARRRADLHDAGEQVYATLGPDERVRYVTLSGAPMAEAVHDLARREHADAIVVGQTALGRDAGLARLLADAPCVVLVAPVGHRFRGSGTPGRTNGVGKKQGG